MSDEQPISRRAAREAAAAGKRRGSVPAAGPDDPRPGIRAVFAGHPRAWLFGTLGVVFALLGTGAVFAGVNVGSAASAAPTPTPTTDPRLVPTAIDEPSRVRTCSIAPLAADPRLMSLEAYVVRADTGEVLFDRSGTTPARTASVMKILTASAAIAALGPDYRITTSVVAAGDAAIALIGRGDATLSATAPGSESVYRGAPKLADLAAQVLAAYSGPPIDTIVLDSTYWSSADKWHPSWARSEQTIGYMSEVTALQVDGDRADPTVATSPRGTDPVTRAGELFLDALRYADTADELADDVTLTIGTAPGGTQLLGEVRSQPISALIPYMLQVSDNTLAEMLARITSKESALNGSAASLQQAIPSALTTFTLDGAPILAQNMTIIDGSGLSHLNAVAPDYLTDLLMAINRGEQNLNIVRDGLPVAGQSGTLASRFTGANEVARGRVSAKTGWIDTAYTLAGMVAAADGTVFTFAFYAIGDGIQSNAREALDTLTTGVYHCGDNLSNN